GLEIARDAQSRGAAAAEALEAAEKRIFALAEVGITGQAHPAAAVVHEVYDDIDARAKRGGLAVGVPTGFADLNMLTAGLQPSELVLVAARPATGKTAFGLALAHAAAADGGLPVFVASLEQSRKELMARLISSQAMVDGNRLRRGRLTAEEESRFTE